MQLEKPTNTPTPFRIITFNIRYDCAPSAREPHELPFSDRLPLILQTLYFHTLTTPTFVCLQEALHHQLVAVRDGLKELHQTTSWRHLGTGREDGKEEGEFNPILYREDQWRLVEYEQKWLSPTPEKPSFGWNAACKRVFVRGLFAAESGRRVTVVNTHFDHVSEKAREKEAGMMLQVLEKARDGNSDVVVLTGDLNSRVDQKAYQLLSGNGSLVKDARRLARVRIGNEITFTGFERKKEDRERIDYVFIGGKGNWEARSYLVASNGWDEGGLMSDHRPVIVDVQINGN
ncbi:DNase I-like protein [Ascobolus immersus RN42]|uniref:DNase I-like protein n=1 Tax=Ascobolus immersus RN42 TaxID=1160509 RepID=A0A3N4HR36_ASCIM|nr:DNase I-like protein [Ascobolus immersus RN42]